MDRIRKSFTVSIMLILVISGLAVIFATIPFGRAQSGTNVSSTIIKKDTTWTKTNSPYTFVGRVGIAKGATLTIESGVKVNLGLFTLEVNGTLIAQGTPNDRITLNSDNQNINLLYHNPTCKIENAILNQTSINGASSYSNASVTINNCFLEGNTAINVWGITTISNSYITGAVLLRGASVISGSAFLNGIDIAGGSSGTSFRGTYAVSGNNITNQEGRYVMNVGNSETEVAGTITANIIWGGSVAGICQADGFLSMSATIEKNLIINNQIGILTRNNDDDSTIQNNTIANNKVGISNPTSLQTIAGNNVQGNSQYNMQAGQTMATAKNNWWGTTDQQAISQTIYDSNDDFNVGTVNFVPFLTEPNFQAPSVNTQIPTPTPSSSQTPYASPTVPELSLLAILPLFASMLSSAVILRHRNLASLKK